jgi:hypothetical protein
MTDRWRAVRTAFIILSRRVAAERAALERARIAFAVSQLGTNGDAIMHDEGGHKKRDRPDAGDDETTRDKKPAALPSHVKQLFVELPGPTPVIETATAASSHMAAYQDYPMGDETAHLKTKSHPIVGPRARGSMKVAKTSAEVSATGAAAEASSVAASIMGTAQSIVSGVIQTVSSWQSGGEEPSSAHRHSLNETESGGVQQQASEYRPAFEQPLPSSSFSSMNDSDIGAEDDFSDPDL